MDFFDFYQKWGEQWQAALFSRSGAFVCGMGWAWGAWVCLDKGCIPTDLWCWRASSSFQRPHLTHLSHTNEWYHMQYFNGTMGEALWNGFFASFVTFWFLWCLIPSQCWHSHTHRELTGSQPWEWGRMGDAWTCGHMGRLASAGGQGTPWRLSAGAKQELHKSVQSSFWPWTSRRLILPRLSFPSFSLFCLRLLLKVLLLLLRCPESRMPSNHSGSSLALPHQPLARPDPGSLAWGWEPSDFSHQKCFPRNQWITVILHWKCTLKKQMEAPSCLK